MGHLSGPNPCPGVLGASYVAIFALFLGASEEQFGASSAPIVLGRSLKRANMGFFIGKICVLILASLLFYARARDRSYFEPLVSQLDWAHRADIIQPVSRRLDCVLNLWP